MEKINLEKFRSLGLPADDPYTAHLEKLISQNEAYLEEEAEATYIRLKGAEEKIWIKTSDSVPESSQEDAAFYALANGGRPRCGTSEAAPDFSFKSISSTDKLRSKSKYYLGKTVVNTIFLSGPGLLWTPERKAAFMRDMMYAGFNILNRTSRNDRRPFPKHQFVPLWEEFSYAVDPAVVPIQDAKDPKIFYWDNIGLNIKAYLRHKSVYHGNVNDTRGYASQPEVLQALYEFVNLLRDKYEADWGYLVFVVPDALDKGREHAYAFPGFMVLFEKPAVYPWVVAHEILHMYGADDEYIDNPTPDRIAACRSRQGGLYDVTNANCETTHDCIMSRGMLDTKNSWRERICTVSVQQLSLIDEADGSYKPVKDFAVHTYEITNDLFKYEEGVFLVSDVIRRNRHLWVHVEGKAKMNPLYFEHGPEGDLKTIVGQDHLLPGRPFGCAVAKWVSIDGTYRSPWFYIGKGEQWFLAPFTGYLVFNINDSRRNWGDNSGNMKVTLWSKLTDNYGTVFVPKPIWPRGATSLHAVESRFTTLAEAEIMGPGSDAIAVS